MRPGAIHSINVYYLYGYMDNFLASSIGTLSDTSDLNRSRYSTQASLNASILPKPSTNVDCDV